MSNFICHDFKTPRTDMSRRLPNSMRIVPVVFYVVLGLSAYVAVNDFRGYKLAETETEVANAEKAKLNDDKAKLDEEQATIQDQRTRAEAYAKWIEGTRVLQPISVAVARAMPPETNITELSLERSPDLPEQISILVRMANGTLAEVSKIEASLNRLHYKSHSPGQAKQGDQVEFRSMLVWQE
jgi:cell division protein FtsL